MSALFGFLVGYVVGARAGHQGFEELVQAARAIRESDEFRDFTDLLRGHAKGTVRRLNEMLAAEGDANPLEDAVSRARQRLQRD